MNNSDLFKLMVEKQHEKKKEYYNNKKQNILMKVIKNRKYKSLEKHKGDDVSKIYNALSEMGFVEEMELLDNLEICNLYER